MNLFILRTMFDPDDERSVLNGQIVCISRNHDNGGLNIVNLTGCTRLSNLAVSWQTTKVVEEIRMEDGIKFTTDSGTVYDFVDVRSLIPADFKPETAATTTAGPAVEPPVLIDIDKEYKPIHYGDGHDKKIYKFDRDVSEKEFVEFLASQGVTLVLKQTYPYQDYHKISGAGNTWTLTKVLCYTD